MDSKKASFYNAIIKFAKEDVETNPDCINAFLKSVIKIDFDEFTDCWEYLLTKKQALLSKRAFDKILTLDTINMAAEKNFAKAVKVAYSNLVISKVLYGTSYYAMEETCQNILVSLLLSQKIQEAENIIKLLQKNTEVKSSFGQNMVIIIEKLFFEILKKQGNVSKKVDMPKKVHSLLSTYVSKIKGSEKALLEQRLREIQ